MSGTTEVTGAPAVARSALPSASPSDTCSVAPPADAQGRVAATNKRAASRVPRARAGSGNQGSLRRGVSRETHRSFSLDLVPAADVAPGAEVTMHCLWPAYPARAAPLSYGSRRQQPVRTPDRSTALCGFSPQPTWRSSPAAVAPTCSTARAATTARSLVFVTQPLSVILTPQADWPLNAARVDRLGRAPQVRG